MIKGISILIIFGIIILPFVFFMERVENLKIFYRVIDSTGIYTMNVNITRLVSDWY